jgi:putative ABC transport system permease protein
VHPWPTACETWLFDLRQARRSLSRSPGLVLVSVLSLAFGIACTSALFSVFAAITLRPAPHVRNQERLLGVFQEDVNGHYLPLSYPDMEDLREQVEGLESVGAVFFDEVAVGTRPGAEGKALAERVSENYFELLGVPMQLGHAFHDLHPAPGELVVVLGYDMWQRELAGDTGVLGRTLFIDGVPHEIVGVAPEGLQAWSSPARPALWVPIQAAWRDNRGVQALSLLGRMAPGVGLDQIEAQLGVLTSRLSQAHPGMWQDVQGLPLRLATLPFAQRHVPPQHRNELAVAGLGLGLAVLLVLIVGCANASNLLLARACQRRHEMAVRAALGAGRRRLIQQQLVESSVIAALAAGLGLLVMGALMEALSSGSGPVTLPAAIALAIDLPVLGFALALCALVALVTGLAPALRASRPDVSATLNGVEGTRELKGFTARKVLVMAQVAGSATLVITAGLLQRSFDRASDAELGFEPDRVALVSFDLSHRQHQAQSGGLFLASLAERLKARPGVEDVAPASTVILGPRRLLAAIEGVDGRRAGERPPLVSFNVVGPAYFSVIGTPVVRGREFEASDSANAPRVAVVNQALAEKLWPGQDPLGKTIKIDDWAEVVGVVRDATYRDLNQTHDPHVWLPLAQSYHPEVVLHVRTTRDPGPLLPALREEVVALDPALPVLAVERLSSVVAEKSAVQRIASAAFGAAGLATLLLAMVGICGVLGYVVSQRQREIGIRLAIGAEPADVMWMVVRGSLGVLGGGLAIGGLVVLATTPILRTILYGVTTLDIPSHLAGVGLLCAAAVAASLPPALRAARTDPARSLRAE